MSKEINRVCPYEGALLWIGAVRSGVSSSTGEMWKSAKFSIKYLDSQQNEQVLAFSLFGAEKVDKLLSIPLGTIVHVSWRPTSRAFKDRNNEDDYFSQLSVYSVSTKEDFDAAEANSSDPAPAAPPRRQAQRAPAPAPEPPAGDAEEEDDGPTDDLPL